MVDMISRLVFLSLASGLFLHAQQLTARQVIERIQAHVGVAWHNETVDTFKAGDPDTPVTGIATTMMATVYHRTGLLVVRWFLGDYAVGLYAAAVRFVDLLRNFVSIALGVLMPRMALAAESRAGLTMP